MGKKNQILIKCEEANHYCDKSQYNEASFWEKVKLNIHLVFCAFCRKYSMRNNKLSKLIKTSNTTTMSKQDKREIEARLKQELSK